jgi:hypothetical protein
VVKGSVPIERDPKHFSHAAHASDPSGRMGVPVATWHPEPVVAHERHERHVDLSVFVTGIEVLRPETFIEICS